MILPSVFCASTQKASSMPTCRACTCLLHRIHSAITGKKHHIQARASTPFSASPAACRLAAAAMCGNSTWWSQPSNMQQMCSGYATDPRPCTPVCAWWSATGSRWGPPCLQQLLLRAQHPHGIPPGLRACRGAGCEGLHRQTIAAFGCKLPVCLEKLCLSMLFVQACWPLPAGTALLGTSSALSHLPTTTLRSSPTAQGLSSPYAPASHTMSPTPPPSLLGEVSAAAIAIRYCLLPTDPG